MSTLYDIVNILPLSLLSVMLFGTYAGIPEKSIPCYLLCIAVTVWLIGLRNMKMKNRLRSLGIAAFFVIGLALAAGEEHRQAFFAEYLWVIWAGCFSLCAVAAGIVMSKSIWIRRAAAAALLAYCVTGAALKWDIGKETFSLICFVLLTRTAEEIQRRWKKSGSPDMKEHITRISPFFLAVCLAVYLLPAPDAPYGWQFAKQIYYSTVSCFNRIYGFFAHPSDDYGNIGFSDKSGFLSGLGETDEEVLVIRADNQQVKDLNLVGCMSGEFKDCKWVFDTESEGTFRTMDTIETSAAVKKYAASSRADFLTVMDMSYETLFYNTKYIFAPAKIRLGATKEKNAAIKEMNGSIISDKKLKYKDKYGVASYVLNYGNPELEALLTTASPIDEQEWNQTAAAEGAQNKRGFSYEDYLEYRKNIYDNYCRTYGVSEEVGKITDNIKNSSANRYEAVKKLEYYLSEMEYSTENVALPDTVTDAASFLDYFLLSSRKGYCMHYATAFVLMANEMGIPCRYVQGYSVSRDSNGIITVRQSNAHAWPEVYFDNAGWVQFEPTPGHYGSSSWAVADFKPYVPKKYIPDINSTNTPPEAGDMLETPEEEPKGISPLVFIIPVLAVISFLLMFYLFSRTVSGRKYRQMEVGEKYRHISQQNIRLLGYLGLHMAEDETLSEFRSRLTDRQDITPLLGFIPVYETLLYSDKEITDEDISTAERIHSDLRGLVKKQSLRNRVMLIIRNQ